MPDKTAVPVPDVAPVKGVDLLLAVAGRRDVPALVAALEVVLKIHQPTRLYEPAFFWTQEKPLCGHDPNADGWHDIHTEIDYRWVCLSKPLGTVCSTCSSNPENGEREPWPCAEYEMVTAALSGSGETPSTAGTTVEEAMADD